MTDDTDAEAHCGHYEAMAVEAEAMALLASAPWLEREYIQIAAAWRRLAQYAVEADHTAAIVQDIAEPEPHRART
ncbi:MAG: hypothetical protein JOZ13_06795 [Alphaproteobacteria bacterium]|nr:hypothetical protein [Alphaproteobacteria bacterium]